MLLSDSIFHFLMKPGGGRVDFLCSFVYGPPLWRNKEAFWETLVDLGGAGDQPWVCTGDFDDILKSSEKRGGREVRASSSRGLRHFMDCLGFVDLGYSGRNFTWTNGRVGLACIRERLDKSIANVLWWTSYPNAGVKHFGVTNSEHIPRVKSMWR